jgi:heme exporter protein D
MNWQAFFAMGGYAFYVWTAYGITVLVLVANIIIPVVQRRQFLRSQALKLSRSAGAGKRQRSRQTRNAEEV